MIEFPRLFYRVPGPFRRPGGTFDHALAVDADAGAELLASGWYPTLPDAIDAGKAPAPAAPSVPAEQKPAELKIPDDNADPTRDELLEKAAELGIDVDRRWGNRSLQAEIERALRKRARSVMD